jgi:hypothetical protein
MFKALPLVLMLLMVSSKGPCWMTVSPTQSFEPAFIHIRIHVDAAEENRMLTWACDSADGGYFSSEIQLDGERAQQTFDIDRKGVAGGEYECKAGVARQGKSPLYAQPQKFVVIPRG